MEGNAVRDGREYPAFDPEELEKLHSSADWQWRVRDPIALAHRGGKRAIEKKIEPRTAVLQRDRIEVFNSDVTFEMEPGRTNSDNYPEDD